MKSNCWKKTPTWTSAYEWTWIRLSYRQATEGCQGASRFHLAASSTLESEVASAEADSNSPASVRQGERVLVAVVQSLEGFL
jgi:hypothetical protein